MGVNLLDLDALAHKMIRERGAESCYIDYHPSFGASPFGKVLCTSVNDAVLHGLPHEYKLRDGDLLSVDFAAQRRRLGRGTRRSASSSAPRARRTCGLIEATDRALDAGIEAARVGQQGRRHLGRDRRRGPGRRARINTQFGGHGVGRTMHGDPHVPNDGRPGRGFPLRPGLVIAIEPWFLHTTDEIFTDPTAGRCAARTAPAARTWSTRSRSPRRPDRPDRARRRLTPVSPRVSQGQLSVSAVSSITKLVGQRAVLGAAEADRHGLAGSDETSNELSA